MLGFEGSFETFWCRCIDGNRLKLHAALMRPACITTVKLGCLHLGALAVGDSCHSQQS